MKKYHEKDVYKLAKEWVLGMQLYEKSVSVLSRNRHYEMHYENFVTSPERELKKVCDFI